MKKPLTYQKAPIPEDEKERLTSLRKLNILDTPTEERFDRITRLATQLFKVPISTITLVDSHREWFKSCQGLSGREGVRAISFCGHAVLAEDIFIISDTKKDPRFVRNPMVVGKPYIRFYAAVPLKAADGKKVGVLCIKDLKPRKLSSENATLLKTLASWVELELNVHELSTALTARQLAEARLSELNEVLRLLNKILRHDILNHLTVIRGNVDFFMKRGKGNFNDVITAVDSVTSLIKQVGDLESAVSAGTPLRLYEAKDVVGKIVKRFPSIRFRISGNGLVLADEALMSVIDNIVRNAKMHGKTNSVNISISNKDNFVEISIADYGVGIPDKIKSKLFMEGGKYGATGHTGLGLYIVKKTIDRYGGHIEVKSNHPKGTVFIIKLPKPEKLSNT